MGLESASSPARSSHGSAGRLGGTMSRAATRTKALTALTGAQIFGPGLATNRIRFVNQVWLCCASGCASVVGTGCRADPTMLSATRPVPRVCSVGGRRRSRRNLAPWSSGTARPHRAEHAVLMRKPRRGQDDRLGRFKAERRVWRCSPLRAMRLASATRPARRAPGPRDQSGRLGSRGAPASGVAFAR